MCSDWYIAHDIIQTFLSLVYLYRCYISWCFIWRLHARLDIFAALFPWRDLKGCWLCCFLFWARSPPSLNRHLTSDSQVVTPPGIEPATSYTEARNYTKRAVMTWACWLVVRLAHCIPPQPRVTSPRSHASHSDLCTCSAFVHLPWPCATFTVFFSLSCALGQR